MSQAEKVKLLANPLLHNLSPGFSGMWIRYNGYLAWADHPEMEFEKAIISNVTSKYSNLIIQAIGTKESKAGNLFVKLVFLQTCLRQAGRVQQKT